MSEAAPAHSRRERRKARARREILEATRELLAEGRAPRVSDITERSDLALGSFYSHFVSKEEAVDAVVDDLIRSLADGILEASGHLEDPAEGMSVGVRIVVGLCDTDRQLASLLINLDRPQERFETMARPQALAVIQAGADSGRFAIDDPSLVVTMATGTVLAVIRNILSGEHGAGAGSACASLLLRAVGLSRAESDEIAHRPLPEVRSISR